MVRIVVTSGQWFWTMIDMRIEPLTEIKMMADDGWY